MLAILCFVPASLGHGTDFVSLSVYPSTLQLNTACDKATFVVQATSSEGITTDVTAYATFSLIDDNLVRREGHTLFPAADGTTQMTVGYGGRWAMVPIT